MLKKIFAAAILMFSIAFTPVGSVVFDGHDNVASAKSYKSGKRGFNNNNPSSNFQNRQNNNVKRSNDGFTKSVQKRGGFMRGMLFGGLAGLMLGGLLGNLGAFGAVIGFLINFIAIIVLIALIRGVFRMLSKNRRRQDDNQWRR
ncbi:hypothetical protein [Peribacillus glennii]|uniref:Preprotein translocase subunit Tim44 n=1 Tax=Peribacillus glennii TaxID=2303991 RepID=A0A372LJH3_9BACI|nr:hypothetical protein [Peribacillus glennii]RFU66575.1 hypothetical protein D0466_00150 [Peribacillus glennii]